jgi:predicted Zn-dependent peptidase
LLALHPSFFLVLFLLNKIANRRLFSIVREEQQLTYDASFNFKEYEIIHGSYYLISVTSSPQKIQAAIRGCKDAIASLTRKSGLSSSYAGGVLSGDTLQSAKRSLLSKWKNEQISNSFWISQLTGIQSSSLPLKSLSTILDYEMILSSITVNDVQTLMEILRMDDEENMTACIGIASPIHPSEVMKERPFSSEESVNNGSKVVEEQDLENELKDDILIPSHASSSSSSSSLVGPRRSSTSLLS